MKIKLLFTLLLTSYCLTAQNIFQDNFASYNINSPLHSQGLWSHNNDPANGGFGAGACNPVSSGGSCSSSNVAANTITFPNYGTATKSMEIAGFLDNPGHPVQPIIVDGDLYVSMVVNISSAPAAGSASDFFRAANSDTSLITFRLLVQDASTGFKVGIRKGASNNLTVYTDAIFNYNQDNLIILKYSHLPGASDDVLNVYVNPDYASGEPLTNSATTSTGFDQSGAIDRIFFRLGFNNAGTMPIGFAGLVSASTNWFGLGFESLSVNEFENKPFTIMTANARNGILTIDSNRISSGIALNIYTITGQLLETQNISLVNSSNEVRINPISNASVYLVELIENNGKKQTQKIIIN